jgi:transcriptional regulator with XRE-family HTH domain
MGKSISVAGPTRERVRFTYLLVQLERKGIGQAELSRRTGMTKSYINALRNPERGRNLGIGAEIVRLMKDGIGLDPKYFYDDYEGERPHELYLLDAKRDEKRIEVLSASVQDVLVGMASMRATLAQHDADHAKQIAELTRQLAEARGQPAPRPLPPSSKGRPKGVGHHSR